MMNNSLHRGLSLAVVLIFFLSAGCAGVTGDEQEHMIFTAEIEEVYERGLLVTTEDVADFDRASVHFEDGLELDFVPEVGQILEIEILPEVRESYPVQVIAVRIERIHE